MIDFKNPDILRLKPTDLDHYDKQLLPIFVEGERVINAFQTTRDGIVFTNKRIIAINIQGMTGKKKDITSLPYSKIHAFSVETAGVFDLDNELEVYFSELGQLHFEFAARCDISEICRTISTYALR